jgi:hypothetical protein
MDGLHPAGVNAWAREKKQNGFVLKKDTEWTDLAREKIQNGQTWLEKRCRMDRLAAYFSQSELCVTARRVAPAFPGRHGPAPTYPEH